jgi:hypothetical protein
MQVGTVLARNLMDGPTVLSSDPKSTHFVEWAGRGDQAGNDVQLVPEEIVKTVPFARAVQRGVLSVENLEDNPELQGMLNKQTAAWTARQQLADADIRSTIETTANKDMVTLACIGPSTKGLQDCGEDVTMRDLTKYDAPPLCHRHINLVHEYVPTNEGLDERDNKKVRWTRSMIDDRVRLPR